MKYIKKEVIFLLFVFLLGFLVRLYRFNNPVADWHSWRQADTAAVTWNFVHTKFDVLHPIYFDISNVQSGKDNPEGYRYVEFPLYNAVTAGLYMLFHGLSLEGWGRIVSIVSSLVGSLFLFLFVTRRAGKIVGWFTLLSSLFLPFNIYYGRTILPDTSMMATMLGGFFFLDKWLDGFREKVQKPKVQFLVLASLLLAISLLLKLYTIFYFFALMVLVYSVLGKAMVKHKDLWIAFICTLLPIILWRIFMLMYPEGIPANSWLLNGNHIRFKPSFFRWIFYERITKLISGYTNALFVFLGTIGIWQDKENRWVFSSFVISALLYVCVIATGNVQHDYYQIVIMPAVAVLIGFGAKWLIDLLRRRIPVAAAYIFVAFIAISGFWLSWLQVRDYFNINNIAIVHAGQAIRKLTPPTAKLLAPYGGDTTLLYYTKRKGWPSFEHDLSVLINMGADYLVLVNPKQSDYTLAKQYALVSSSKDYLLFDLHKKP